jgi:hypothetical protein
MSSVTSAECAAGSSERGLPHGFQPRPDLGPEVVHGDAKALRSGKLVVAFAVPRKFAYSSWTCPTSTTMMNGAIRLSERA